MKPPVVGPTTRPMLLSKGTKSKSVRETLNLSVTNPLSSGDDRSSNHSRLAPSAKVSIKSIVGVVRPTSVRIPTQSRYCKHICTSDKKYTAAIRTVQIVSGW